MTATVTEAARQVPVDATYQIAVAGGGIAGVAAALAAARRGRRVVLIEKQCGLGGLATLGNVIMYLPLCDGYGKQVMGGLAEELIHRSVVELKGPVHPARFLPVPDCWNQGGDPDERRSKRFMTGFNPYAFQMEMEQMLQDAGVTLMYDTRVCRVIKQGRQISHLLVENKSGRLAVEAKVFIDATGDADVCHLAGCATEEYPFNVLAGWYYEIHNGDLKLITFSEAYDKEHRGGGRATGPFYSGTDHRDVTRHVLDTRSLLRSRLEEKRRKHPDDTIYPFGLPSIPDLRVTRRLHNRFSLGERHRHVWLDDCVGVTGDWRRRGPIYPVTLSSIRADECPNLFAAGRCLSADHTLIDVTRAIGTCAVSGEACGAAAAMLTGDGRVDRPLSAEALRSDLIANGAMIGPELLTPHPDAMAVAP